MMQARSGVLIRYGVAIVSAALATAMTLTLRSYLNQGILSFFFVAVITAAWFGGLGPGLLVTVLSVMSMAYFFMAPTYSLAVHSANDIIELIVFSLTALVISMLNTAQKKAQSQLRELNEKLEDRVVERTAWLTLVHDITGVANETETVDQALRFVLKRITSDNLWRYSQIYTIDAQDGKSLLPSHAHVAGDDPALLKLQDSAPAVRIPDPTSPVGRVQASCAVEWIPRVESEPAYVRRQVSQAGLKTALVFPVVVARRAVAVVECFTNQRVEQDKHLGELMAAVGFELGVIIERKQLQEGYTDAVWQQQRHTAQELHDGLGQRLTGLWLLGASLAEKLGQTEHSPLASKLAEGVRQALEDIRGLAKGVFPVDLDPEGLMAALPQLVDAMGSAAGIACRFECPDPVVVEDNRVAMHLYRIAQEALTNALKHAGPQKVVVRLESSEEGFRLTVTDDGVGMPALAERHEGAGLRIMRYRAAAMDAALKIESNGARGTVVTCLTPRTGVRFVSPRSGGKTA